MGLDMYLRKKIYVGANYEHRKITGTVELASDNKPLPINFNRISEISEAVGYWRKANQIHKWFVDNVQGGEDDCKEYSVYTSQLKTLFDTVQRVLDSRGTGFEMEVAERELPPQEGFFFGEAEVNEWYWKDLEYTKEILTGIFQEIEEDEKTGAWIDYTYQASW